MSTSFRARLRSGERLIAPLVTLNSPAVAELLAEVGFDWLFIDAEHSPLDTAQMQALMQGAGATPCVVRLSASDDLHVKRALDIGAAGIIAPQVNSVEHAQRIVQAAKYAPAGQRGLGIARAHRYGLQVRQVHAGCQRRRPPSSSRRSIVMPSRRSARSCGSTASMES